MLSDVLVDQIAASIPELVVGTTLFSEHLAAEKGVSVFTTANTPWGEGMAAAFRSSRHQILIRGYSVAEGKELGEKIVEIVEKTAGPFTVDADANYTIYSTQILNLPTLISAGGFKDFSFNVQVNHHRKSI